MNGDALQEMLPEVLEGERIVMRECLVDGDVSGTTLRELYANRARFISTTYEGFTEPDYYVMTVPELEKIQRIRKGSTVNLWFEDDLFCQVNLWFVCHLLQQSGQAVELYLVRPATDLQYGFGGLDAKGLLVAYQNRQAVNAEQLAALAELWHLYQMRDHLGIMEIADGVSAELPFLLPVARAYIDALP